LIRAPMISFLSFFFAVPAPFRLSAPLSYPLSLL
jgi:hypothetical protein